MEPSWGRGSAETCEGSRDRAEGRDEAIGRRRRGEGKAQTGVETETKRREGSPSSKRNKGEARKVET